MPLLDSLAAGFFAAGFFPAGLLAAAGLRAAFGPFTPAPGSLGGATMTSAPEQPAPWQDFQSAAPKILDEIIRQGEARLQAQLAAAIAADTRSGLLASIQGAASVALFVAGAQTDVTGAAEAAANVCGIALALGAGFGVWASRPVDFGFPGNNPSNWLEPIQNQESLQVARAGTAHLLDKYLKLNDWQMRRQQRWTLLSVSCLIVAPIVAFAVVMIDRLC
jgi:hypothetical protein